MQIKISVNIIISKFNLLLIFKSLKYIIENKLKTNYNNNQDNLQNVLIENAFYYTDNIWVYDKESMEKVGYVDRNNADINYILTSDPFILQNF